MIPYNYRLKYLNNNFCNLHFSPISILLMNLYLNNDEASTICELYYSTLRPIPANFKVKSKHPTSLHVDV